MDAAVRTHQQQQQDEDSSSRGSMESIYSEKGTQKQDKSEDAKKKKKRPKSSSQGRNTSVQERISQYREGKLNLPAHEVVQNSIHLKTGKVDLQLCDDTMGSGGVTDTVQGSMLIQVSWVMQGCSTRIDIVCSCRYSSWWWMSTWTNLRVLVGVTGTNLMM